jgi:phytoene synthase
MTGDPIIEHCRAILAKGSRSFSRAAALLPRETRAGAYQLYAWCRYCDDLIDNQILGHSQSDLPSPPSTDQERLTALRTRTARALAGDPDDDLVFRGLARIVRQHGIPTRHPEELLEGMAMDVAQRRYRTIDELTVYCYHVAGVVGVMMAHIMGIKDPETLARAEDLGIAMQMTNIARDVRDDAAVGRVYLPLDWLDEAGVSADTVGADHNSGKVAMVVARLLDAADGRYTRADRGISHLPFRSAWSIAAARFIYADIGRVIRERGDQAWQQRAVVSDRRKYLLVAKGLMATLAQPRDRSFRRAGSEA